MAQSKNKKKKKVFNEKNVETSVTGSLYDPTFTYGRKNLKGKEFFDTKAGSAFAQANQPAYFNWLLGESGFEAGPTPLANQPQNAFNQYLQGNIFPRLQSGYEMALGQSGGRLEFQDYMNSVGWGQQQVQNALTAPSNDTGNPFTSSSGSGIGGTNTAPAMGAPTFNQFLQQQGYGRSANKMKQKTPNKFKQLRNQFNQAGDGVGPSAGGAPALSGIDAARRGFLHLDPVSRGEFSAGYSYQPSRWSVF